MLAMKEGVVSMVDVVVVMVLVIVTYQHVRSRGLPTLSALRLGRRATPQLVRLVLVVQGGRVLMVLVRGAGAGAGAGATT